MKNLLLLLTILLASNVFAIQKKSKEDVCKRVVDKNMQVWIEVCELSEKQQKELYNVLMERQRVIYDSKKANKNDKVKQKEEATRIREEYMPKVEKVVGLKNIEKMNEYFEGQVGFTMLDLLGSDDLN